MKEKVEKYKFEFKGKVKMNIPPSIWYITFREKRIEFWQSLLHFLGYKESKREN